MSAELAFADVRVASRASGLEPPFVRRSRMKRLQLGITTNAAFLHRYATAHHEQSECNAQSVDRNRFINTLELIHDKFSCRETQISVYRPLSCSSAARERIDDLSCIP